MLVIDVGGGTADFTVIRLGPDRRARTDRRADVLANDGIHIAGTDFDSRLNLSWVMPALGYGTIGRKGLAMPSPSTSTCRRGIASTCSTARRRARRCASCRRSFVDPVPYERLRRVIEERLGHELLGRTEAAKIELSDAERTRRSISRTSRRGSPSRRGASELLGCWATCSRGW